MLEGEPNPNHCLGSILLNEFCWWEKPLLVALKHSEGIKHTILFQETNNKLTNTRSLQYTPSLFLSSVSLYSLPLKIT